ncbi:MAG: NAD(P)/FAD-dependent oxidoreductase, partial [Cyanobacteria bacterium J06641_2]
MQDSSFIFTESTSSRFIQESENNTTKAPLLAQFNVHRGWLLFLLYYFSCYIALGFVLYRFVGFNYISIALSLFASIQLLRLIPSQGIREFVKKVNYTCVLWLYRVNYLCTLSISISLCLAPFAACIYIASLYGTTASVLTGTALLFVFLYVLYRREVEDNKAVNQVTDIAATTDKKTVAVIGGGVAGIVAAKEAMQEGHKVVVYEQASCFGGVWNSDDSLSKRTTGRTFSSSSRHNSFFGDFPMNPSGQDNELSRTYPSHYSEADYREYLAQYTEHFDLVKLFKFNTSVESTERTEDGKWEVKVRHQDGTVETNIHDFVIVSTGLNHQSHALKLSQTSDSNQLSMGHSATYRDKEDYRNKKVVIVGMGESSSDLAAEVASVAQEVHVIVRSPVLLLPRNTFGQNLAPDHKLS